MLRRLAALALLALAPWGTACGDGCGTVDCPGSSVGVVWVQGDLPRHDELRLCLDGDCGPVEVNPQEYGPPRRLVHRPYPPADDVQVRLEVRRAGAVVATWRGEADMGGCCHTAQLIPAPGHRLVPGHITASDAASEVD